MGKRKAAAAAPATEIDLSVSDGAPTWQGAVMLPVDKLVFTEWNVNEMDDSEFSELVAEIEEGGFDEPVGVVPAGKGNYLVLSGEHRVRASHALGLKEVPAVIKTHLSDADEATLKMWSVKRNNIRGRINAEKFKALERNLSEKHQVSVEAARQRMLVKGELLKSLKKDEPTGKGSKGSKSDQDDDVDLDDSDDGTQESRDSKEVTAKRKKLLAALKDAEEEVLIQSADTVEHGYLFFGQGQGTHLVVNESPRLWGLVKRMVSACKDQSAPVDEFLSSAIEVELTKWEK